MEPTKTNCKRIYFATNPEQWEMVAVTTIELSGLKREGEVRPATLLDFIRRNSNLAQIGTGGPPRFLLCAPYPDNPSIESVTLLGAKGEILQHGSMAADPLYGWAQANAGLKEAVAA
jgi:hypothetical protein